MPRDQPSGFVSLSSLKRGAPDAQAALAEIRRIYFKTTRETIEHDFTHAIELLKSLGTEEAREKAAVYMEGLAEMRKEWQASAARKAKGGKGATGRKGATGGASGARKTPRPRK